MTFSLHGIGVSGGYAIGRAQLYSHDRLEAPHYVLRPEHIEAEVARFAAAVETVHAELLVAAGAYSRRRTHGTDRVHRSACADPVRFHAVASAQAAHSRRRLQCRMGAGPTDRSADRPVRIDRGRLPARTSPRRAPGGRQGAQVADGPSRQRTAENRQTKARASWWRTICRPSDMVLFKRHAFAGFITDLGGATSHTAILARSLNLPSVMALHNARALIREDDWLIVDGVAGVVIVDPDHGHPGGIPAAAEPVAAGTEKAAPPEDPVPPPRWMAPSGADGEYRPAGDVSQALAKTSPASACSAANSCSSTATTCPARMSSSKPIAPWPKACTVGRW
jgi:phosphoenolpyruvate-protein phosphotransferase (PTS system enzyme I)